MIRLINSLGAMKDLPISVAWKDVPLAWSVPNERLGGDGAVPVGPRTLEPRSFELRGSIYHYDKAQIRAYHDDLLAFLRHTPLQVYQHHQDDRFIWATPTGNPQQWIDGRAELQMQVQMIAHDPYWYGPEISDSRTVTDATPFVLASTGTAQACPSVTLALAGSAAELMITNAATGQTLDLVGSFTIGDVIVVDNARYTITLNSNPAMDIAGELWLAGGYALEPGNNTLTFTCDANVLVSHIWRPRWL